MKNKFSLYSYTSLLIVTLSIFITGCEKDDKDPVVAPTVLIDKVITTSSSELTIVLKPNETTTKFTYAIGNESDREAFTSGTLSTIKEFNGNEEQTVLFPDLEENSVYTIFAQAYNSTGSAGPLASVKAKTRKPLQDFAVSQQYVTDNSTAFTIKSTTEFYKYDFALGKVEDRKSFEAGVIEGFTTKEEISEYTANYFNLDANTEYVFFVRGYDRQSGEVSETREIKVKTAVKGSVPTVSFKINHIDMFSGEYTFTPNEHCGRISVAMSMKDKYQDIIDSEVYWKGNMWTMLKYWTDGKNGLTTIGEEGPLKANLVTSELLLDEKLGPFGHPLEAYVLLYDKNNEIFGIQKFEFNTPSYDDNAGDADVDIKISNVTENGAFYEFFPNEHTMGIVFETFDAEWYENLLKSPDYYDGYIDNYILQEGYWNYCYKVASSTMPERTAEPGKRYYVFYMAMNNNGPYGGLSRAKSIMYQTPEKSNPKK